MPYYHIQIKPLEPYFFGDERSFNSDDNANYFVRSRIYPQQSTLLGALRYDILRKEGKLQRKPGQKLADPNTINALIGEQSFDPNKQGDFGLIQRLSATQFQYLPRRKSYMGAPLDLWMKPKAETVHYLSLTSQASVAIEPAFTYFDKKQGTEKNWLAKEGLTAGLLPSDQLDTPTSLLDWEGVRQDPDDPTEIPPPLKKREKVGIIKDKRHANQDEDESGFFRQVSYQIRPEWCFEVYAEIATQDGQPFYEDGAQSIIPVGGEKTPFQLTFTLLDAMPSVFEPAASSGTGISRVLLTSDAYVANVQDLIDLSARAVIGDPVDFRAIQTRVNKTEQYTNITGRGREREAHRAGFTTLFQLIPRSSVFYVAQPNWIAFQQCLQGDHPAWTQIGYNQMRII